MNQAMTIYATSERCIQGTNTSSGSAVPKSTKTGNIPSEPRIINQES